MLPAESRLRGPCKLMQIIFIRIVSSGRTQVLYEAHVLYCALSQSALLSLDIAKKCFFVLYFLKNVFYKLFKWVEFLF